MEEYEAMRKSINIMKTTLGVGEDGWISNERYSAVKAVNEEWKESHMNRMSKEGQEGFENWWPFSDRAGQR